MMTDRELLEAAAKAAGINVTWTGWVPGPKSIDGWAFRLPDSYDYWNPLADDGDALRLAVKLGMAVYTNTCHAYARLADDTEISKSEEPSGDRAAATRRAIVRAAAAIGGAKP
jgi:hypothetical protein